MTLKVCPECNTDVPLWREMPINPELAELRDRYISPVKLFNYTLRQAMQAWGTEVDINE